MHGKRFLHYSFLETDDELCVSVKQAQHGVTAGPLGEVVGCC